MGMEIKDQECVVNEEKIEKPNLTLKSDALLATKILSGEVDGMRAYMMGKLKLFGDLSLAMKLASLFNK
jgi:putative sterol carrier protein